MHLLAEIFLKLTLAYKPVLLLIFILSIPNVPLIFFCYLLLFCSILLMASLTESHMEPNPVCLHNQSHLSYCVDLGYAFTQIFFLFLFFPLRYPNALTGFLLNPKGNTILYFCPQHSQGRSGFNINLTYLHNGDRKKKKSKKLLMPCPSQDLKLRQLMYVCYLDAR